MAFRDDVLAVLSGGIPALAGDGQVTSGGSTQSDVSRPEQTPEQPQLQDMEPFSIANVSATQILVVTAVLVGAIGFLAFARR